MTGPKGGHSPECGEPAHGGRGAQEGGGKEARNGEGVTSSHFEPPQKPNAPEEELKLPGGRKGAGPTKVGPGPLTTHQI